MIQASDGLWPGDSSPTDDPVALHISKENMGIAPLWLYHLQSLVSLSRALWLPTGCFSNNKCFTSDLMINLVHDSSNLSIWKLKLPFHKYQTIPSIDTPNKHNFGCILCTKHNLGIGPMKVPLPKAYSRIEIRDKILTTHRSRNRKPLQRNP